MKEMVNSCKKRKQKKKSESTWSAFHCGSENTNVLLLDFLFRLLFVVFKIHDRFLSQFQITLKLSLRSLKVHTELLLLLQ